MKKLVSILTSLMLLISMCIAIPAHAGSVGEWVADFKAAANGKTTISSGAIKSGSNYIQGGNWGYNSDGDYADMNANEGTVMLNSPTTSDYTLGFKMQMGATNPDGGITSKTYGVNTALRVRATGDVATISGSTATVGSDGQPEDIEIGNIVGNVFWIYPVGECIKVYDRFLDNTNATEKTYYFSNDEWVDVKFIFDFDDNAEDDLLSTMYIYLNGKKVSTVEIPVVRTISNATCYFPEANFKNLKCTGDITTYGISKLILKGGKDTLIKDMYAHDGLDFDSSMEKSNIDNGYTFKSVMDSMTGGAANGNLKAYKFGSPVSYRITDGSAKISYTGDGASATAKDVTDLPCYRYESGQQTDGNFVYRVKVKFNDFNTVKKLAEMASVGTTTNWHSSLLDTEVSAESTSRLKLSYVNSQSQVVTSYANISKDVWYSIEVVGNYTYTNPYFIVNVSDASGNKLFDNVSFYDYKARSAGTKLRFRLAIAASTTELNNFSGTTVINVDDLYIAKLSPTNKVTVDDVKLYQEQNIIKATETFDKSKELKVSATVYNNSDSVSNGTLIVAQYASDNSLIDLVTTPYTAKAAKNIYTDDFFPAAGAPSVIFTPESRVSYIKLFVMDSIGNITPYTKSLKINAQ